MLSNERMNGMNLTKILAGVDYQLLMGGLDIDITNINYDSRKVDKNGLFVCIKGLTVDGHDYAKKAVESGCVALIVERPIEGISEEITVIQVKNTQQVMALMANNFYGYPSGELKLIGLTGTNGKTTTTNLIATILEVQGEKVGVIGTIENRIGSKKLPTAHTTPQAFDLQQILRQMKNEEVGYISMEVSSHALDLHRVDHTSFEIGVFTNLTLDHLDYHKTMENYSKAKAKLFTMCNLGLFNIDDPHVSKVMDGATCKVHTYGIEKDADFKATNISMDANGVNFTIIHGDEEAPIHLSIPGKFSIYNGLAAASTCRLLGIEWHVIQEGLAKTNGVRGRFETIKSKEDFTVIVDYAHAPDGLENVLKTINEFAKGKVYCVFGCGGDRDRSKRPVMGEIAGKYSDFCIITSDNPRTEEPNTIIDEIEPGVQKTGCDYVKVTDRKEGIEYALRKAKKDDVILIAGKGHEDYQIIGKTKIHFDDSEVVKEFLEAK